MKIDELNEIVAAMNTIDTTNREEAMKKVHKLLVEKGYDLGSFYQELEMRSRFVECHQDVSYANDQLNLHSHDFYEILYCKSNSGIQYLVGAQRYRLQRGDIVMVPPGVGHRPILDENLVEPYRRDVIWMSKEFVKGVLELLPEEAQKEVRSHSMLRTAGTRWETLGDYFRAGIKEAEQRAFGWQAALCGNTTQLVVMIGRAMVDQEADTFVTEKTELIDEVVAYIETNLANKITATDTAKRFWVSESTINQTFRQKMGVSFHHYVTQRRLIAAKGMILDGIAMEDVSECVGFSDYSTFYRAFKQEFGISPRQYRRLNSQ